jgi:hypothetical protein
VVRTAWEAGTSRVAAVEAAVVHSEEVREVGSADQAHAPAARGAPPAWEAEVAAVCVAAADDAGRLTTD